MSFTRLEPSGVNTSANFTFANVTVNGNVTSGNANLGNAATANYFIGNGSLLTGIAGTYSNADVANYLPTYAGNVSANYFIGNGALLTGISGTYSNTDVANYLPTYTGNVSAGNVLTNNLLYANGVAWNLGTVYSNTNVGAYLTTYNGNISANYIFGNGIGLTVINGSNVINEVANATYAQAAIVAGTVQFSAQPNITSTGTLVNVAVSGNANVGNLSVANYVIGNLIPSSNITYNLGNNDYRWNDLYLAGNSIIIGGAQIQASGADIALTGNIESGNANLGNLAVANYFSGNGSLLSSITGGNVVGQVGNALVSGTVYSAAQPNITSVGTLTSLNVSINANTTDLNVSGNATVAGNLTVNGNVTYINVESLVIEDPIIEMGGGPNGNALTTNDGKDRGEILHYYTTAPIDAFMGWDNSNGEFAFGSNVSVASEVVTFNSFGNIRAGYFIGNGSALSSITGANVTGQVGNALVAGTVYTNAQPNITSLGTLANLAVTSNVSAGNVLTNNLLYANGVAWSFGATYSNTNVAAYLPTYTGNVAAGNVLTDNLLYANGSPYSFGSSYSNTNVAAYLPTYTGNVAAGNVLTNNLLYANGVAWSFGATYSNTNVAAYLPTYTGNVAASYFIGNGSALTSITGGNVTGQVSNALVAGTVYTAAQPNITSLGTLSSLTVTGLITTTANGVKTANIYDSTGTLTIETQYGNKAGDAGIYGNLTVGTSGTGNITAYNANLGNLVIGNFLQGTLTTSAQPNITSVGMLSSLSVTANVSAGNILTDSLLYANGVAWSFGSSYSNTNVAAYLPTYTGNVAANYFIGNGSTLTSITGANVTGQVANALVAGTVYTNAQPNITSLGTLSSLTVTGNVSSGNANLGNLARANFFSGDGSLLTSITGSNIAGQVGNALVAGTVYTNAQPNITSVGTLSSLTVTGNVIAGNANLGNLAIANFFSGNGSLLTSITGGNVTGQVANALVAGTVYTAAQPNITSLGTLSSLNVTGNVSSGNSNLGNLAIANFFSGNGSLLSSITGGNVNGQVANALVASTVYTNAQPNITSVGTLSILSVTANISAGNILTDSLLYANGIAWSFGSSYSNTNVAAYLPTYTGNVAANYFIGNGSALTSITGANVTGQVGNALVAGTVYTNAQPNITSLGTLSSLSVTANVSAGNILSDNLLYANGVSWSFGSSYSNTNVAAYLPTYTGNVTAGNLLTNNLLYSNGVAWSFGSSYSNTNVAAYLPTYTGNVAANYFIGNGSTLTSITGSNVSGQVGNALVAGTVYTNAQPNITSVGTLTSLNVTGNISSGNANLGNAATANFFVGNGSLLTGISASVSSISNGTSNINIGSSGGNITAGVGGTSNVLILTSTGANVTGYANVSANFSAGNATVAGTLTMGSGSGGNLTGANVISANLFTGTLTTGAQPNITSVGTLSSLTVTGLIIATSNGIRTANIFDSTGTVTIETRYGNRAGDAGIYGNLTVGTSGTGNITSYNANLGNLVIGNFLQGTLITGAQPNITSIGALQSTTIAANSNITLSGSLAQITGANLVSASLLTGALTTAAQPNITSVGTLQSTTIAANSNVTLSGSLSQITGANLVSASLLTGTLTTAAQPNITTVGTLSSLSVTANVSAGNVLTNNLLYANGVAWNFGSSYSNTNVAAYLPTYTGNFTAGNISGANLISGNFLTGTLTTAAQTNITSVGTLASLTVSGDASVTGWITSQEFTEVTQSLTGATGTVTHNVAGGLIFVHTSVAASFTANFTNVPTTDNRSIVVTIVITQGATGFIPNAVQINSVAQTINWPGGVTPTGNANKRDVFTFALLRVSGAWTVLGNNGTFG